MKNITIKDISYHKYFYESIHQLNVINGEIDKMGGYVAHNHHHVLFLIKELLGPECKNYLEIGTALGSSMISVMKSKYDTNFYGIDLFLTETGSKPKKQVRNIINNFNKKNHKFYLIEGDSKEKNVIDQIKQINEGIDLFYIDGNHTADYAYSDFINYEKFLNPGGIVVFDDSCFGDTEIGIKNLKKDDHLKNYIDLGRPIPSSYKLDKLKLDSSNKKNENECIYTYDSSKDDVSLSHFNWQQIFQKQ
jgi:predicted O-methyltransferase YrrM